MSDPSVSGEAGGRERYVVAPSAACSHLSPMPRLRTSSRVLARLVFGVAAGAAILLASGPAAARVVAEGRPTAPGETTVTFTVDRGCGGAPTTSLKVRLPAGAADVVPQVPRGR